MINSKISKFNLNSSLIGFFQDSSKIPLLILLIASYFIFFWKLGEGGIRQWDESSLAVNALEMSLNGNPIVKYLGGEIDLINTKPPLTIWFIVGCMKIFGYTEFALRLPSAICAVATVIIIYSFSKYYLKNSLAAFASSVVLITSIGFTGEHVARTGDYDAMLVLWMTIYSLSYFIFLESNKESERGFFLKITTVALILAVWTKGIAGLLVLPGLFIYTFYRRKIVQLLLSPRIYYSAIIFITLSLSYYLIREFFSPGFLKAVMENELTGRYMDVVPGGTQRGFLYYLRGMISYRFIPCVYILPVCLISTYANRSKFIRKFSVFALIYFTFYFLIISYAKTKFDWYDAPLYPVTALLIGLGIATVLSYFPISYDKEGRAKEIGWQGLKHQAVIYILVLVCIFFLPFSSNLYEVYKGIPYRQNDKSVTDLALLYRDYFKELEIAKPNLSSNRIKIINTYRYNLPLLFYVEKAGINKSYSLDIQWETPTDPIFQNSDVVINCDSTFDKVLQEQYLTQSVHQYNSCKTLVIKGRKD